MGVYVSKIMDTTGLGELLARIAGEFRAKGTIYDIPEKAFRAAFDLEASSPGLEIMGGRASLPVGPAAGPSSQIAPNLVAAYLAGARVFELKTVQVKDALDIDKPCIDVLDEGHNTEWSTELTLTAAREEYLRGWIAIGLLASIFSPSPRAFLFNLSVGYTLEGIRSPSMDAFIEAMRAPAETAFWKGAMRELEAFVESESFRSSFARDGGGAGLMARVRGLVADFPSSPVHSVTLSTMHGCPPEEIERIGAYLIEDKGFDAFVKLNPTLLGFDEARAILDETGWKTIEMHRDNFERDLQFPDALRLIASLDAKAKARGRSFGIKLSNTLANENRGSSLPGGERYMSGRALFPLTVRLAADLAAALPAWESRFSYCGGAWAANSGKLIAAGLGPVTIATDILKPGGYLRLLPAARAAVAALPSSPGRPDAAALARLADFALAAPEYRLGWKSGKAAIPRSLPLYDCFAAPCIEACPVGQKVPEYIRLGAKDASDAALACIIEDNPLPFVTGTLCDHACQEACCRNDYEGPVEIRAVKLAIAKTRAEAGTGAAALPVAAAPRGSPFPGKVAVIGAGPAGLACAHYLALAGAPVAVFDGAEVSGGIPANVIPRFRLPLADLAADTERIRALGAEFRLGERSGGRIESLASLEAEGFTSFFVCTGAPAAKELVVEGDAIPVVDALSFLAAASRLSAGGSIGDWPYGQPRHVVVAGGGDTAMDAVRVALRLPGIEEVRLSYRRSRDEMPADEEELKSALEEGGKLMELTLPEGSYLAPEGPRLVLRAMKLGEPEASGRRSAQPTERTENVDCELLVAAVGETPDASVLASLGIPCGPKGLPTYDHATQETSRPGVYVGGDAAHGPASIIRAEADGRRAAFAMLRAAGIEPPASAYVPPAPDADKLAARGEFVPSARRGSPGFVLREAERCLTCDSACLRCVEVCPNRSNFALPARAAELTQPIQILHVDSLCNECGNCGTFCPFEGEPYKVKPTLFKDRAAMEDLHAGSPARALNPGFCFVASGHEAGARPSLLVRARPGAPIAELSFAEWAESGSGDPMVSLARAVFNDHPYLLGASS
jgi:putative selenate reductase